MGQSGTEGKVITCKAAVAWSANTPLDVTDVQIDTPKKGEIRIRVVANALCHTDIYTLMGHDPEGIFPSVLGHEATGIVESIGEDVTTVKPGDSVIPCYTPECQESECIFCSSSETNLCPKIRSTQGKGLMPDGTSRISKDGKSIYHFMGCSTFAEYAVIPEIAVAKIPDGADLMDMCLLGCGVSTGWGAVINNAKMESGRTVVVFGLGALGLAVIQASKMIGARRIVAVDLNTDKFDNALSMGATETVVSTNDIKEKLMSMEDWGFDYTFDCTGNVNVMRTALEVSHRGWGKSIVVGVAAAGKEISTRPFQLVTGRQWLGTAFGGWKSRSQVPQLVRKVMRGEMDIKPYITHRFEGLDKVNESIDALHGGTCLRAVVKISDSIKNITPLPKMLENTKLHGGNIQRIEHWSESCQCNMVFSIFIPKQKNRFSANPPLLIYLSGLTCSDENARTKSNFAASAAKYGLCVLFPDTSPRMVVQGDDEEKLFYIGEGASFYVNATEEKWKNYQMYDYITKELPEYVGCIASVDTTKISIMGHSMGGHGALMCYLKNPGMYKSISALAPLCNFTETNWGIEASKQYLGSVESGKQYDPLEIIKTCSEKNRLPILIDQGTNDEFLDNLKVEKFVQTANKYGYNDIHLRMQSGYDHSYFFVSTFMKDHIEYHAVALGLKKNV